MALEDYEAKVIPVLKSIQEEERIEAEIQEEIDALEDRD